MLSIVQIMTKVILVRSYWVSRAMVLLLVGERIDSLHRDDFLVLSVL